MKADKNTWCSGTRAKLSEVLPLETPLTITFEASSKCNIKCTYCVHGSGENKFIPQNMDIKHFITAIDSLSKFPSKIKNVVFAMSGEPLMNPMLPEMISYVKEKEIAESVTVFTNATLLTPKFGKQLIEAGLDLLRVSIQGLSDEKYTKISMTRIKFKDILNNLTEFYKYKGNCKMFVKIIDIGLDNKDEEQLFYDTFGNICDTISIERLVPVFQGNDYSKLKDNYEFTMMGNVVEKINVCPQPFYGIYVRADGNILPCCVTLFEDLVLGHTLTDSLYDIWNGDRLKKFRIMQLTQDRYSCSSCKNCEAPNYSSQINDRIDDSAGRLLSVYKKQTSVCNN